MWAAKRWSHRWRNLSRGHTLSPSVPGPKLAVDHHRSKKVSSVRLSSYRRNHNHHSILQRQSRQIHRLTETTKDCWAQSPVQDPTKADLTSTRSSPTLEKNVAEMRRSTRGSYSKWAPLSRRRRPWNLTLDLLLLGPTPTGESATVSTTSPMPEGQRRQGRPPTETGAPATASLNCWWERRKEFVVIFSNWRDYYVIIIIIIIIIHLKCLICGLCLENVEGER